LDLFELCPRKAIQTTENAFQSPRIEPAELHLLLPALLSGRFFVAGLNHKNSRILTNIGTFLQSFTKGLPSFSKPFGDSSGFRKLCAVAASADAAE
jgi:hypothetical protein